MNDLSIIRNDLKFEHRFTQIPNEWIRDPRIGFKAKGVLHYLLSHQTGWRTSIAHLAASSRDGRDAIRTAILELEQNGYLKRTRIRESGKLVGAEWTLADPFESPMTENPTLENPTLENPMLGNPTLKNTNNKNTNNKKTKDISPNKAFDDFWAIYPRKTAKANARIAYQKALDKISTSDLQSATERFSQDPNLPEEQFIPHAATWLNQERWADGPLPQRVHKPVNNENAKAILERALALQQRKEVMEIGNQGNGDDTSFHIPN